jgi:dipeptidyl aminopeptidase/acylaminoacyl peptidase
MCALAASLTPQASTGAPKQIFLAPFEESAGRTTRVAFLVFDSTGPRIGKPVLGITTHAQDDDEPAFLADSTGFLFTSNRDGKQSDVYRYDIKSKAVTQVTRTPEDERGPVASADGRTFTVARGPERRLWRFNNDGTDAGPVSSHPGGVLAHAWLSPTTAAAIVSSPTEPGVLRPREHGTLQLIDSATGSADPLESGIGSSVFVRPDRSSIGFVRTVPDGSLVLREWAVATRKARETGFALEGADSVTCTPAGKLLMARQSKVFLFEPQTDRWIEFADLEKSKVRSITRLAVSPDGKWIAAVSQATTK